MVDLLKHTQLAMYYVQKTYSDEYRAAAMAVDPHDDGGMTSHRAETLIRIGVDPTILPRNKLKCPYVNDVGCHYVQIAGAFQYVDTELTTRLLDAVKADFDPEFTATREKLRQSGRSESWYSQDSGSTWRDNQRYQPPPPRDESYRQVTVPRTYFYPEHAAWYHAAAINVMLEESMHNYTASLLVNRLGGSIGDTTEGAAIIKRLTTRHLLRSLAERARPSAYATLAQLTRHAEKETVKAAILGKGGAYRFLLAFFENPTGEEMIAGLAALAKTGWTDGLDYLVRAPTIDEIGALRADPAAAILLALPWSMLEPMLDKHEGLLRTALFGTDVDLARKCLANHAARRTWQPVSAYANPRTWEPYQLGLVTGWQGAKAYREAVKACGIPAEGARYLLFAKWSGIERHQGAFDWLDVYPDLAPYLETFPAPYRVSDSASYRSPTWDT
jgi:hypothetical protein